MNGNEDVDIIRVNNYPEQKSGNYVEMKNKVHLDVLIPNGDGNHNIPPEMQTHNDVTLPENNLDCKLSGSTHSLHEYHNTPLPSTREEKQKAAINNFTSVLGFIYVMFLLILSSLVFAVNPVVSTVNISNIITLFIVISGFIIISYVLIDLIRHIHSLKYEEKLTNYTDDSEHRDTDLEEPDYATNMGSQSSYKRSTVAHEYCFVTGRHAGSTYLKFGATAFAMGHLVHCILLGVVQINIMSKGSSCLDIPQSFVSVLYPIYSFIQLIFVFKYSNVVMMKHQTVAVIAFLHIIAGNLCLWVLAVTRETQLALNIYKWSKLNVTDVNVHKCRLSPAMISIVQDYTPYMFPFSVEFNILIAGMFYTVWSNIGHCKHSELSVGHEQQHLLYTNRNSHHRRCGSESRHSHALMISINCHGSSRSLFAGVIVLVLLIVIIILGFVFGKSDITPLQYAGYAITDYAKLGFHTAMLVAVVVAYNKTRYLDVSQHPVPLLDDVLLYVCVPLFFLETLFTVVATVNILNVAKLLDTIIMSIQMVIQTAFIIDGLRRCSNSRMLRRTKPGRELILFLLITNVTMWMLNTFSYQSPDSKDERYLYYGKELWTKLGHLSAPLIMFYRFHSSVCLADIWSYAYSPGIEDSH